MRKKSSGYRWFVYPQKKERYTIFMFGYDHNRGGEKFPSGGDILSLHMSTHSYLNVGKFLITDSKNIIVLAIDELGLIYGKKNINEDYLIIDSPPVELLLPEFKTLEEECFKKKLNIDSELYFHALK